MRARALVWFHRFTAVHFLVTAATGLVLYFRPGGGRPGWYSERAKDVLVAVHNGEWLSWLVMGQPFWSGVLVGVVLAATLGLYSLRALRTREGLPGPGAAAPSGGGAP